MSIELPGWLDPLLNMYGIPWPDVDEDAFHDIQQPLTKFGKDLVAVSDAIESAVNELEAGNPSQTLTAIKTYCVGIRRDFLDPIQGFCDDLAGTPCEVAYDAIVAVKYFLIGLLSGEVLSDVADVVETVFTLGLDSELTAAEAEAVKLAVQRAMDEAESEVASELWSIANSYLDSFVSSLVNPFINAVEGAVEGRVESYLPRLVLHEAMALAEVDEAAARRLHLSPEQLNSSIAAIWRSSDSLYQAASTLEAKIDEIFSKPDPKTAGIHTASQAIRMALQGMMKTIKADLLTAIETLIQHVESHFVTLIEDFAKALAELDAFARTAAAAERMAAAPEVVVLSAASAWIAASTRVDETSGRINATEADGVKVEETQAVAFSASTDGQVRAAAAPVGSDPGIVARDSGVQSLDVRADLHGPGMAEADKGILQVEELKVPASQGGTPHVDLAQASGVSVQGVAAHPGDNHAPQVGVAEGTTAATGLQHLHKKQDPHTPTTTTAEAVEDVPPSDSGR